MPQHEIFIKGLHPKLLVHKHKTEAKAEAEAEPYVDVASYRNIVLIALLFLISTTPRTHGVIIGGVTQVNVLGRVSCVVPATLPTSSSPPLRGVSVNVTCNYGTITLGQAVTNAAGFLNATFNITDGLLFDSSTCVGTINLSSITSCSVFPPTGILPLTLVLVSVVEGVVVFVTGLILN